VWRVGVVAAVAGAAVVIPPLARRLAQSEQPTA
jgi:hypothetical protein